MFPYTEEEIAAKVAKAAAFYWKMRRGQARKQKKSGTQDAAFFKSLYLHLASRILA